VIGGGRLLAGVVGWLQVSGGPFDDAGLASGVVVKSGVPNPTPRPFIFYGGAFANVSVDAPFSASPIRRNSFGKLDAFVVSFDGTCLSVCKERLACDTLR
jgi:hypothetical protein